MIDQKQFSGILNTDDSVEVIAPTHHKMAYNIRFRGLGNNMRAEGVPGTTLIPNSELPTGVNSCLGSFYDGKRQRLIWANYNNGGKHGWYQYNLLTKVTSSFLICFTDSQTDILGFDLNFPIPSINIIYQADDEGDLLVWAARNKRPKILNLLDAVNNLYGANWLEEYLDVAKAPFVIPPQAAYEDDATVTVNNLREPLWIFRYRPVYDDNLKGCYSAWSNIPIPFNYSFPAIQADATKNAKIRVVLQTGNSEVKKIEVVAAQLGGIDAKAGTEWSLFFRTAVINKSILAIPDNDVMIYDLYNNEAYPDVDERETALPFDYVPDIAYSQELLNGNVIVYGGIQEGKDPVTPTGSVVNQTAGPVRLYEPALNNPVTVVLSATQFGTNGFQTGQDIKIIVIGNSRINYTYNIVTKVGVSANQVITYTSLANDNIVAIIAGLVASATGLGFTIVGTSGNSLVVRKANVNLLNYFITGGAQTITKTATVVETTKTITITAGAVDINHFLKRVQFYTSLVPSTLLTVVSAVISGADLIVVYTGTAFNATASITFTFQSNLNESVPAYPPSTKRNYALVYFDEKGKTDGVLTAIDFNGTSNYYDIGIGFNQPMYNIPYFLMSITNRPPIWAKYFHIVRTDNLTMSKFLYWMSNKTFKDDKYAYISIETIESYNKINPNSIISYDFATGDRIRFCLLFNPDGTPDELYQNEHDYEIFSQELNPEINGTVRQGQFLKIILPTTNSNFDFGDGTDADFYYYLIILYTPAKSFGRELTLYKEFGQEYMIINPGTTDRCHQGMIQNQSIDLVTPATYKLENGDAWFRRREINVGSNTTYEFPEQLMSGDYIVPQTLKQQTLQNTDLVFADSVAFQGFVNDYNSPGWTLNVLYNNYDFRIKGVLNFIANNAHTGGFSIRMYVITGTTANTVDLVAITGPVTAGQQIVANVDVTITCPPATRTFLVYQTLDDSISITLRSGSLTYQQMGSTFDIGVFDQNFSDFFVSRINGNGRVWGINPDEKTTLFPGLMRWSLQDQEDTNINQINRFYPQNNQTVDKSFGIIQRLFTIGRQLVVMQNLACGDFGVYSKFVQSGTSNLLTTTDEILTKNNISYYKKKNGCGDQFTGAYVGNNSVYFTDPVNGSLLRLVSSGDGIIDLTEIYKGQFFFQPSFIPYNNLYLRPNGSRAKLLGAFNPFEEEAINAQQGGILAGVTINAMTYSFNEKRNAFCSLYNFINPDWLGNANNILVSWKDGQLYFHDNENAGKWCEFYGEKFNPSITLVFNDKIGIKKTFEALAYQANQYWLAQEYGDVITNQPDPQTNKIQESAIRRWNFEVNEGRYYANLNRNVNSGGDKQTALVNGQYLKGGAIEITLTYFGNDYSFIYLPYTNYSPSPRNY